MPTLVPDQGGARMAHPQLVVITYADDENRATLEANAAWLTTSGLAHHRGARSTASGALPCSRTCICRTTRRPRRTNDEIATMLAAGIADHSLPSAADGSIDEVLYIAYFPRRTTISDTSLGQSCTAYGGYHFESTSGGRPFSYAVIPNCHSFNPALTDVEFEEETVAHELIEAATDALPETSPAFSESSSGPIYSPWVFVGSGGRRSLRAARGPAWVRPVRRVRRVARVVEQRCDDRLPEPVHSRRCGEPVPRPRDDAEHRASRSSGRNDHVPDPSVDERNGP